MNFTFESLFISIYTLLITKLAESLLSSKYMNTELVSLSVPFVDITFVNITVPQEVHHL